jgi:hypothetical protein
MESDRALNDLLGSVVLAWVRATNQEAQFGSEHANTLRAAQDLVVVWSAAVEKPPVLWLGWGPDGPEGGVQIGVGYDALRPISDLVPRTSLERTETVVSQQLRSGRLRALVLLPGLTAEGLAKGLGLLGTRVRALPETGEVRSTLRDAGVARLLGLPVEPLGADTRRLSDAIRLALDVLHEAAQSLDGVMAESPLDAAPAGALGLVTACVPSPVAALPLLASVDLALGRIEPASRRRWLEALVRTLPDHWWSVLHTRCDDVVEAGGGAKVLRGQEDSDGIPLIGYFIAAQVLGGLLSAVVNEPPRTRQTARPPSVPPEVPPPLVVDSDDPRVDHVYGAEDSSAQSARQVAAPVEAGDVPSVPQPAAPTPEPSHEVAAPSSDASDTALDPRTPSWVAHFEAAGASIMSRVRDPSTARE